MLVVLACWRRCQSPPRRLSTNGVLLIYTARIAASGPDISLTPPNKTTQD